MAIKIYMKNTDVERRTWTTWPPFHHEDLERGWTTQTHNSQGTSTPPTNRSGWIYWRIEIQILDFWKKPRGREKERSQAGSWSSTESLGTEKRERRGKQERREKREKERQCLRLLKQTNRGLEKCDVFLKVSNIFIGLTVMFFYY